MAFSSTPSPGDYGDTLCMPCGLTKDSKAGSALASDCFCLEGFRGSACDRLGPVNAGKRDDVRAFLIEMGWKVDLALDLVAELTDEGPVAAAGALLEALNVTPMVADFYSVPLDQVQVTKSQVVFVNVSVLYGRLLRHAMRTRTC